VKQSFLILSGNERAEDSSYRFASKQENDWYWYNFYIKQTITLCSIIKFLMKNRFSITNWRGMSGQR